MAPGMMVKILEPFASVFPGTYRIEAIEGDSTAILSGIPEGYACAFDFQYLEVIP